MREDYAIRGFAPFQIFYIQMQRNAHRFFYRIRSGSEEIRFVSSTKRALCSSPEQCTTMRGGDLAPE
jgi:hypothetical protein